jgi:hypothetical protein
MSQREKAGFSRYPAGFPVAAVDEDGAFPAGGETRFAACLPNSAFTGTSAS